MLLIQLPAGDNWKAVGDPHHKVSVSLALSLIDTETGANEKKCGKLMTKQMTNVMADNKYGFIIFFELGHEKCDSVHGDYYVQHGCKVIEGVNYG
jgi:hypothetical protein